MARNYGLENQFLNVLDNCYCSIAIFKENSGKSDSDIINDIAKMTSKDDVIKYVNQYI